MMARLDGTTRWHNATAQRQSTTFVVYSTQQVLDSGFGFVLLGPRIRFWIRFGICFTGSTGSTPNPVVQTIQKEFCSRQKQLLHAFIKQTLQISDW